MSNIQQANEQKAPTFWHVLLVGTLLGGLIPLIFWNSVSENDWWGFFFQLVFPFTAVSSILGAAVGRAAPKKNSWKWKGLWIGAVLGTVIGFGLSIFYILSAGQ